MNSTHAEITRHYLNAGSFDGIMGIENRLIHMVREIEKNLNATPEQKEAAAVQKKVLYNLLYIQGIEDFVI